MTEALLTGEAARAADQHLLHDAMSLLTTLEHEWARSSARRQTPDNVGALNALEGMTNAVAAFVTTRCHDRRVLPSRVLAQLADTNAYTQLLGETQERITVSTAADLLENWNGDPRDRRQMLQDLCCALIDVLTTYCSAVSSLFHSPDGRDEWSSTVDLFVEDLRSTVRQIAA